MADCPAHLLARLRTLNAHILDLAARLGQHEAFESKLAAATTNARRAIASSSTSLVTGAIEEHRRLALEVHVAAQDARRASDDMVAVRHSLLL